MAKSKSKAALLVLLLSAFLITTASAAIYYQIMASMTFQVSVSPVAFTNGSDTDTCGGDTVTNNASITFSSIPLPIGANITITELVNLTNSDTSNPHYVKVNVSSVDFAATLDVLLLYLVSPSGSETLVVKIDDAGAVETEGVEVNIPAGEVWAMKLVGCYDADPGGTNSMTLSLRVTG